MLMVQLCLSLSCDVGDTGNEAEDEGQDLDKVLVAMHCRCARIKG